MKMNTDEILNAASNGNGDALAFLKAFVRRAHWVDDIVDRPPVLDADAAQQEAEWLLTLAANQFFLAHRAQLVPVMILALNAWRDSRQFEARQQSVLKGLWHEVVYCVAWLTGGWKSLSNLTTGCRVYDVEPATNGRHAVPACDSCRKNLAGLVTPKNPAGWCADCVRKSEVAIRS